MGESTGTETNSQRRSRRRAEERAQTSYDQQQEALAQQQRRLVEQDERMSALIDRLSSSNANADNIQQLWEERQLAALRGELDVSPALEAQLAKNREQRIEQLRTQLGADYIQTSAGQQALSRLAESESIAREAARSGQLVLGENALSQRTAQDIQKQNLLGNLTLGATSPGIQYLGRTNQVASMNPFTIAPGYDRGAALGEMVGRGLMQFSSSIIPAIAGYGLGSITGGALYGGGTKLGGQYGSQMGQYYGSSGYGNNYSDIYKGGQGGFYI